MVVRQGSGTVKETGNGFKPYAYRILEECRIRIISHPMDRKSAKMVDEIVSKYGHDVDMRVVNCALRVGIDAELIKVIAEMVSVPGRRELEYNAFSASIMAMSALGCAHGECRLAVAGIIAGMRAGGKIAFRKPQGWLACAYGEERFLPEFYSKITGDIIGMHPYPQHFVRIALANTLFCTVEMP